MLAQELHRDQFAPRTSSSPHQRPGGEAEWLQGSCLGCISSWERRKQQGLSRGKGLDSPPQLCPPGSGWEEGQPDRAGGLWGQSVLGLEERIGIIGMEWELSGWNGNYWDGMGVIGMEWELSGCPLVHFRGSILLLSPSRIPRNGLGAV